MLPIALALALAATPPPDLDPLAPPEDEELESPPPRPDPAHRSVYRTSLAVDLPVIAGALAGALVPNQFPTRLIRPSCPCSADQVNPLDRFAIRMDSKAAGVVSDWTVGLSVVVPAAADALRLGLGPALRDDLVILTETIAVNSALVTGVKFAVQRPLPLTYAGRDGLAVQAQGYRSFYSGHTSTAVAALTAASWTIQMRDGPQAWPWIVTAAAGASVAVERVAAGRHFPTDVLVGGAVGFGVGTLVPLLHARVLPWKMPASLSILPARDGLAVAARF